MSTTSASTTPLRAKPLTTAIRAKRILDPPAPRKLSPATVAALTTAPAASPPEAATTVDTLRPSSPMVLRAEPVGTSSPTVALGLWFWNGRFAFFSGILSAVFHTLALVSLGLTMGTGAEPKQKFGGVELHSRITHPVAQQEPELLKPVPVQMVSQIKSVVHHAGPAHGAGSAGEGGGRGGGSRGGVEDAGLAIGPVHPVSGGTGFGTDAAYGTHMLGEVGEPADGATFFGVKAAGRKFIFVVDTSGSMHQNDRYLRCRDELIKSLRGLSAGQQYFVMFFSNHTYAMPENQLVDAKPEQLQRTIAWLATAEPGGGTQPWNALKRAILQKPDAIYFLTDGEFDVSIIRKVDNIQPDTKRKIPIHTIAFQSRIGALYLEKISEDSRGQHQFVP